MAHGVGADLNSGPIQLHDLIARHVAVAIDESADDVSDRDEVVRLKNRQSGRVQVLVSVVQRDHDGP